MRLTESSRKMEQLQELYNDRLQAGAPLSRHTTARVGGPADLLYTAGSADELLAAVQSAHALEIPYFILGGGSNVLVADEGMRGLVILNKARKVSFRPTGSRVVLTAESGTNLASLARQCISKGLGGLEWAIGIPGTVGGAIVGNAGAHGSDTSNNLLSATIWEQDQGVRVYHREEMDYGYRTSILKQDHIDGGPRRVVLSAELQLKPESVDILTARAEGFTAHRKAHQPGGASTGSMFKNPENFYAGYLIESAGLKGFRVGDVYISEKHANFFINDGEASAEIFGL